MLFPFEHQPLSQGAIVRAHYLVEFLRRQNEVWYAFRGNRASDGLQDPMMIANSPNRYAQLFSPVFLFKLWRLVRRERIERLMVTHFWSGLHGVILSALAGLPLLVDTHNVEYLRFRRLGSARWPFVALLEWIAYRRATKILCVSEVDKTIIARVFRVPQERIVVVANGADVDNLTSHPSVSGLTHKTLGLKEDEKMVLFYGSLNHGANAQAADIILDEIAGRLTRIRPQQDWRLVITGLGQEKYLHKRRNPIPDQVLFSGFAEAIAPIINAAHVIIAPIVSGSGTRFKIIEGVASGRRVISTTIGAEGLNLDVFGEALWIRDDWDDFAQAIAHALDQQPDIEPPAAFVSQYDWQHILERADLSW